MPGLDYAEWNAFIEVATGDTAQEAIGWGFVAPGGHNRTVYGLANKGTGGVLAFAVRNVGSEGDRARFDRVAVRWYT